MTTLLQHFNHPYRVVGNMRCPWHGPDIHPSARLYEDQDTFWCWTCNPQHGVDVIEFVVIELQLEVEVDPSGRLDPKKRRPLAILRALDYLEEQFNCAPDSEAYETRIANALAPPPPVKAMDRKYWTARHLQYLMQLAGSSKSDRYQLYADALSELEPLMNQDPTLQAPVWDRHVELL